MVGEGKDDDDVDDLTGKRRKRTITNYSEGAYEKRMEQSLLTSDIEADDDEDEDSEDDESYGSGDEAEHRERFRWGGAKPSQWKHDEAKKLLTILQAHGYGTVPWSRFVQEVAAKNGHSEEEVRRDVAGLFATLPLLFPQNFLFGHPDSADVLVTSPCFTLRSGRGRCCPIKEKSSKGSREEARYRR